MDAPEIKNVSVKVMRSHDYCHFEIVLGTQRGEGQYGITTQEVDELRKEAARLADKAVEQYKRHKKAIETDIELRDPYHYKRAKELPEDERSPKAKAIIKYHEDAAFRAQFDDYYDDDWQDPTVSID